ncbi:MAG: ATP synthase subunit I [Blautia sp.]|nr:ATP synthase subunit I [Blautia sp.]MCM1202358.1 ATP synthase subunit I [Bacteroides fragilis]
MEKDGKIKIDATLFDLCLGIFLYGAACQIIILFFSRKPEYSIGLWIGVLLAIAGSVHMWWTIDRSLDMASKDAGKTVGTQYLLRYFILAAAMALLAVSGFADPILAFLGYMGMKISAYMQPFTRKISSKLFKI